MDNRTITTSNGPCPRCGYAVLEVAELSRQVAELELENSIPILKETAKAADALAVVACEAMNDTGRVYHMIHECVEAAWQWAAQGREHIGALSVAYHIDDPCLADLTAQYKAGDLGCDEWIAKAVEILKQEGML